jgi:UDP-N-acetylglucosamine--dolichyl-phosphate N-acetylglucosaminephosphotransferase
MTEILRPRHLPSVLLFSLVPVAAWFVVRPLVEPVPPLPALYVSFGLSIFALLATIYLVPALGPTFVKANLKGRDLLKTYSTPMFVPVLSTCSRVAPANPDE